MPRTVPEIAALVRQGMSTLDTAPFADLFAADAVYELPFLGHRVEGREAIVAALNASGARAHALGVREAQVVAEVTESGFVLELTVFGRPSSVGILTVEDDLITHTRDYTDTAAAAERLKAWSPADSPTG